MPVYTSDDTGRPLFALHCYPYILYSWLVEVVKYYWDWVKRIVYKYTCSCTSAIITSKGLIVRDIHIFIIGVGISYVSLTHRMPIFLSLNRSFTSSKFDWRD